MHQIKKRNQKWTEIARQAAEIGGDILLDFAGKVNSDTIETKSHGDWVSEADRASEDAIVDFLQEKLPDHAILTEERGFLGDQEISPYRWIIDPLDGTTNYLRGIPIWAVSIGLEDRTEMIGNWGKIISGVVHIPTQNETYHATRDCGAFHNEEQFTIGTDRDWKDCLFGTGFPFRTRHLVKDYLGLLEEIFIQSADVRRPGSAAVDLCWVAEGQFDGFWELDLAPWDVAAGSLIIEEAGGKVSNFQGGGDCITSGDIVCGSPKVFEKLLALVSKHFPKSRDVNKSIRS